MFIFILMMLMLMLMSIDQDPYGNYVVQYILGICSREEAATLVEVPIGKVSPPSPLPPRP